MESNASGNGRLSPFYTFDGVATYRATKSLGRHKTHDFPRPSPSILPRPAALREQKHKHRAYSIVAGQVSRHSETETSSASYF